MADPHASPIAFMKLASFAQVAVTALTSYTRRLEG
ncbi:hypothetical protein NK6_3132 [Bradyrhizobium diazoefficiens]|uniref:Uncharacterized protein n=1 Tax=Bradyrhizobium diazoefficiens TaxID=1355477 RepID=A0A0E3VTV3_9BRAD|nr:hypothetical protein NK6_3132 [Bradyrhizobium diazoefficiens]